MTLLEDLIVMHRCRLVLYYINQILTTQTHFLLIHEDVLAYVLIQQTTDRAQLKVKITFINIFQ